MRFLMIASLAESLVAFRGPLLEALQERGLEVHVAAPDLSPGNPVQADLEARGLIVHPVPLERTGKNIVADVRTLLALHRLMRRVRPDFVMSYTIKPVIYGMLAAWMARVPRRFALITGLGYAFGDDKKRTTLRAVVKLMYGMALGRAHTIFFQNPDDEALFRSTEILSPGKHSCVVNGSGVDTASFWVAPLPEDGPRFLLIARLLGDKGVREYAEAARRIRARGARARFGLVGWIDSGPDAIAQQELDAWVADGSIDYLGRLTDVRPAIAGCNIYVLPSYREGTPRSVLEAMAMGRPIITTDAPGCRETVIDGENGLLVPVKSVSGLEQAMLRLIEDWEMVVRMGQRSRQIAESKYDVHKVNATMLHEMGFDDAMPVVD
ncbi:N, N'-diacetylbacillosaminyl-diphospho-undecaprenol alpha-1,3-N-acetylgalactosaminyltransferase [Cupriavidus yeoncheonensis]|uniref:N, N'-diacetylbacillosaminyl-diphospho-undecaprenol alpha-1,3-N-acetylgalactosaminyltransferase n=1 Tax=Cupriavidus yeoncheonensis TaxID=1462994 RepID=A0A916NEB9_9BURK|nr:glycosyltransferase family 4 protein [Cupriavidus yeoncheonensis]CAG2146148.1 N, N'-diacetylbacillosaminyl-diphospho-undecaprenol alpha-1,3-N-acetylgalactosaminyltransferase [Cupriavidus yeoncheonensis]